MVAVTAASLVALMADWRVARKVELKVEMKVEK